MDCSTCREVRTFEPFSTQKKCHRAGTRTYTRHAQEQTVYLLRHSLLAERRCLGGRIGGVRTRASPIFDPMCGDMGGYYVAYLAPGIYQYT